MDTTGELINTLDMYRRHRAALQKQIDRYDKLITLTTQLIDSPIANVSTEDWRPPVTGPKSVFTKVVGLMEEANRTFTVAEILDEWVRRGDPIQGAKPGAAVRTAISEAMKKKRLRRVREGVYVAEIWNGLVEFDDEPGGLPEGLSFLAK
jgi:hypothetical protein